MTHQDSRSNGFSRRELLGYSGAAAMAYLASVAMGDNHDATLIVVDGNVITQDPTRPRSTRPSS